MEEFHISCPFSFFFENSENHTKYAVEQHSDIPICNYTCHIKDSCLLSRSGQWQILMGSLRLDGMMILSHEDTLLQNVARKCSIWHETKKGLGCTADRAFLQ